MKPMGGLFCAKKQRPLKIDFMGLEASNPLSHQAVADLLWLLLKSLHHGGLNP